MSIYRRSESYIPPKDSVLFSTDVLSYLKSGTQSKALIACVTTDAGITALEQSTLSKFNILDEDGKSKMSYMSQGSHTR